MRYKKTKKIKSDLDNMDSNVINYIHTFFSDGWYSISYHSLYERDREGGGWNS